MPGRSTACLSRVLAGITALLLVLGIGVVVFAACSDNENLWRIADLFFDLSLVVTMVTRGGSLLRP